MSKEFFVIYLTLLFITFATTEAKGGGRGGSRGGGGRSRGRSSSSRSGSLSSVDSTSGWFSGFFNSKPYGFTYRPTYNSYTYSRPYHERTEDEEHLNEVNANYAAGYSISRALNADFLSIFHLINGISKLPRKIKNKEFITTTTTERPRNYNEIRNTKVPVYNPYSFVNDFNIDMTRLEKAFNNEEEFERLVTEYIFGTRYNETKTDKWNSKRIKNGKTTTAQEPESSIRTVV